MLPLNAQLPAQPREEHLARAAGPVLRPGRALHRALRRLARRHRLAQRQDRQGHRRHEGAVGHLLGVAALDGQGRDPGRRARRARDADAARRDARGRDPRPQHRGRGDHREGRATTSRSSRPSATSRSTITDYQTLPEGKSWLHHAWSGDLLAARLYYMPKGVRPTCSRSGARRGRRRAERLRSASRRNVQEARARARLPQLHARREERLRQLRPVQRLHAAAERDRRRLAGQAGADPEEPRAAPSCGPTSSRTTRSCSRSASRAASSGRTPGRSSRRASGIPLDLARARGSRRRLALGLLPGRALRGALRRPRQPEHAQRARAVLEPARLERRLPARRRCATSGTAGRSSRSSCAPSPTCDRDGALAADRLPRRLLRRAPRRPLARARAAAARPAVLDQLPDADAGVDQPALARRLGHAVPARLRHRRAVREAGAPLRRRAAGSTASRPRS